MKNLFFTSRFYRKLWLLNLKAQIMKPISFIKAMWKTVRLYRNSNGGWERYVKRKEEEVAVEEQREKAEVIIARSNFIGAAFQVTLCQLIAINPHTKEQEEKNFAEFQQSRKELQESIKELEKYGTFVPEELKSDLLETPIDTFKSIEEWEVFTDSFNQKINF